MVASLISLDPNRLVASALRPLFVSLPCSHNGNGMHADEGSSMLAAAPTVPEILQALIASSWVIVLYLLDTKVTHEGRGVQRKLVFELDRH